ncbi:MAG: hypothetical protein ACTSW1_05550 [Candidatus Hodarchaeales archaeon]
MIIPQWLSTICFVNTYAILWSAMEVEIEGVDGGWAKNLPTDLCLGSNFTWYHVIMNGIVALSLSYSLRDRKLSEIVFYTSNWFLVEDFMWFMLNKGFGWENYTQEAIWWHGRFPWYLGMPLHNYVGAGVMWVATELSNNHNLIKSALFSGATILGGILYGMR